MTTTMEPESANPNYQEAIQSTGRSGDALNVVEELFGNLDKWRHFPSYQLERRADIFFSVYLKGFLEREYKRKVLEIIPEFPLHRGTLGKNIAVNKSYKIDYVVRFESCNEIRFVELKTDNSSVRKDQVRYLEDAVKMGLPKLLKGIEQLCGKTEAKGKYAHLQVCLKTAFHDSSENDIETLYDVKIVYLLPREPDAETMGVLKEHEIFYFSDFANYVAQFADPISQRFAQSLREWSTRLPGD